jgi:hypothetical protein
MTRAVVLTFALAACDSGAGDAVDAPPLVDAGPNDHHPERVGVINLVDGNVFANLHDRAELPTPTVVAREGECAIYARPPQAACAPACSDGLCTATNTCTPWPVDASADTITVTGLRRPLAFRPGSFGYVAEPAPPDQLFDPGSTIRVSAPGAVTPAFSATVVGTAQLAAPFQNLTLVDGKDQPIRWTAANDATIQVSLVVGWHGAPYEAMLQCETADDGELVIPGALISRLPRASSGLEPHPSWLRRFNRTIVDVPAGPVEVIAGSETPVYFTH